MHSAKISGPTFLLSGSRNEPPSSAEEQSASVINAMWTRSKVTVFSGVSYISKPFSELYHVKMGFSSHLLVNRLDFVLLSLFPGLNISISRRLKSFLKGSSAQMRPSEMVGLSTEPVDVITPPPPPPICSQTCCSNPVVWIDACKCSAWMFPQEMDSRGRHCTTSNFFKAPVRRLKLSNKHFTHRQTCSWTTHSISLKSGNANVGAALFRHC